MEKKQAKLKAKILQSLESNSIIFVACKKVGIARATYYRWLNEDPVFAENAEKAINIGRASINDLAESMLIKAINEGHLASIKYWLNHNHRTYSLSAIERRLERSQNDTPAVVVQFMGNDGKKYNSYQALQEAEEQAIEPEQLPDQDQDQVSK